MRIGVFAFHPADGGFRLADASDGRVSRRGSPAFASGGGLPPPHLPPENDDPDEPVPIDEPPAPIPVPADPGPPPMQL